MLGKYILSLLALGVTVVWPEEYAGEANEVMAVVVKLQTVQLESMYARFMRENYRATLKGDRLEWQGDAPAVDGQAVTVQVTLLPDVPSQAHQGARMAAILEQLAAGDAASDIDDPVAWERDLREDRELPDRT